MKKKSVQPKKITHRECLLKLKQSQHELMNCLIAIIEALDPYTRDHSRNVANYALLLAEELNLPPAEIQMMHYAGLFHDIGKIGIAPDILKKQSALTDAEYAIIQEHPIKGANIIAQISDFAPIVTIILHHHEHMDGKGYPEGLKGEEIPLGSRLIAVVDAYDAITTNRAYRKAQGRAKALEVIKKATPDQFDPEIVQAFLKVAKNL